MNRQNSAVTETAKNTEAKVSKTSLTIEALEARIAPALLTEKKSPTPPTDPPYPPGTRYGLIRRDSLR